MRVRQDDLNSEPDSSALYDCLLHATPLERTALLLGQVDSQAPHSLALPFSQRTGAVLDGIDLSPPAVEAERDQRDDCPPWWDEEHGRVRLAHADLQGVSLRLANLQSVDLSYSDLRDASLGKADLRGARLEEANLVRSDLAGADLRGAALGNAKLGQAMLEEAQLTGASMRFADLEAAALEGADLAQVDLWGANLTNAILTHANLQNARLEDANFTGADLTDCDLRGANLRGSKLCRARLTRAYLEGAILDTADLQAAVLSDAKLQGVDLERAAIDGIWTCGAWLDRTRLQPGQLGGVIGEERAGEYEAAAGGYLALERNFVQLGDPDAASWAYRKRRRMQKRAARRQATQAWRRGQWQNAIDASTRYASDRFVEWLCDYGESVPRVLRAMLLGFLLYTCFYALTGSLIRVGSPASDGVALTPPNWVEVASFSLLSMTTATPPSDIQPANDLVFILVGFQALLGIVLAGLLGFVVGNRIRR